MSRSKKLTDDQVLQDAIRFVGKHGVESLTFSTLSKQVGLAPATLVQRFGTKQNLLAMAAERCFSEINNTLDTARQQYASPLKALEEGIVHMSVTIGSPQTYANGLALFAICLSDAEAYVLLQASARQLHNDLRSMLDACVEASELKPLDTDKAAYALHALYEGTITTWSMHKEGTAADWVRKHFKIFIQPYVADKNNKE